MNIFNLTLLFNTSIINRSIVEDITKLINRYPLSITNEQGYLNIYFLYKNPIFVPLQILKMNYFTHFGIMKTIDILSLNEMLITDTICKEISHLRIEK